MTNKITEDTIMGALASTPSFTLSISKFMLFCIGDQYQENRNFIESRGADIEKLQELLENQVVEEDPELAALEQFQRMLSGGSGTLTRAFKKVMDKCKKSASDENREMYFEDFINALYDVNKKKEG